MIWDRTSPCASCPYRKDAPLKLWHKSEFENLLRQDADPINGHLFGCHEFNRRDRSVHRPCAGWLLDQKRRGMPSIQLRLALMTKPDADKCFESANDGGVKTFRTLAAMCRANGVSRELLRMQKLVHGTRLGTDLRPQRRRTIRADDP